MIILVTDVVKMTFCVTHCSKISGRLYALLLISETTSQYWRPFKVLHCFSENITYFVS